MKKLLVLLLAAACTGPALAQMPAIIPQPARLTVTSGSFSLSPSTIIVASDQPDREAAGIFNDYLSSIYGFRLRIAQAGATTNSLRIVTRKFIRAPDKDAYLLQVAPRGITIEGDTYAGSFYALQSLIQLLPLPARGPRLLLPACRIEDYPRFNYRGLHLDVARHFFPVAFVKRYIDYLALHKFNYFHWHLTDDQGWRIEIKKYPRLTSIGGWRNGTIIGRYPGTGNDNQRYGGFYTQAEVRDIVAYAAARYITVIPEIEMPGHASAAIAAYPWLSCFPDQKTAIPTHPSQASEAAQGKLVQETWGVFEDVYCAGSGSTFAFLQDVLDEVIALFPSKNIHVGGDECPKVNWKKCPKCQARMKALNLKDEHELQSYFIQRMENYLGAKHRRLLGWDEILEGGLAPNAIVMSWRGESGGIEAATQNHEVVMTPQKPVYFDYSQTKNEDSLVIGGYNPIEQVYAYEPIPATLDSAKARYVLGAQANVWTEYMPNESKVEYMVLPRMSALAEVVWSPKASRSWSDFEKRLPAQLARYDAWKVKYSKAFYDLKTTILPTAGGTGLMWKIEGRKAGGRIRFTSLATSGPGKNHASTIEANLPYSKTIAYSGNYRYQALSGNGSPIEQNFYVNKATGKKISVSHAPNEKYPGQGGAFGLVNGVYSNKGLSYPDWIGWIGDDLEATIVLSPGKPIALDSVRIHTVEQNGSWIYLPASVTVEVSTDDRTFHPVEASGSFVRDTLTMGWITVPLKGAKASSIRVTMKNYGLIPDGLPGAGNKAWLFADEIQAY